MSGDYYNQVVMGPCKLYTGALGVITAAPTDANVNVTPAVSAGWVDAQGTNGGVTWSHTPKATPLNVDQTPYDIDDRISGVSVQVVLTLATVSLANLALALNTTVGATGANFATLEPNFGPTATQAQTISLLVDGLAPPMATGLATPRRRFYLPRAKQVGKVMAVYAKDKQVGWDLTMNVYYVNDSVAPYHITDQTA